jgi:DNA-binding transcriptional ArsR family regulator
MIAAANLVEVAALVGDTARATMLAALMGGQWLTATELACRANVSRSTASGHLSKLVTARLITVTRKRRFSYYRIASPLVATILESIKVVAAIEVPPRHQPRSAHDDALRFARSCYDHLAGKLGVAITDALVAMGHISLTDEGGFGRALPLRVRRRSDAADSADFLPALSRLERVSLSPQGTRRSSDSGSSIGARMAQMCVGQPCTPTNVVWKGGLVRNLPDRDQQRGCAERLAVRRTTANRLSRAKRHLAQMLQAPAALFDDPGVRRYVCDWHLTDISRLEGAKRT